VDFVSPRTEKKKCLNNSTKGKAFVNDVVKDFSLTFCRFPSFKGKKSQKYEGLHTIVLIIIF